MSPRNTGSGCRTDANHTAVVQALMKLPGCMVQTLAAVGCGCPDLLVGYHGTWRLAEVKDGAKSPSARDLTDAEKAWHRRAKACGCQVEIWESAEQAVCAVIGAEAQK